MIKRLTIVILMASAVALAPLGGASAQVMVGAEGGVNFGTLVTSWSTTTRTLETGSAVLWGIRGVAAIRLAESLSLRTGMGYLKSGGAFAGTSNGTKFEISETLHYIEFPVLFAYTLDDSPLQPQVFIGPSVNLLMSGKLSATSENKYGSDTQTIDITDKGMEQVMAGLEFGMGLTYALFENLKLTATGSCTVGLTNFGKTIQTLITNNESTGKTQCLRIQAGLMIRLR